MTQSPNRICILGGGFGGLYTALRLNDFWRGTADQPEIVLVDQRDRFLFSPLLYELVTGELSTWEIAPPYAELLGSTGIRFVQGNVAGIDIEAKRVRLQDGLELPYSRLVLAMGGETPLELVPGAADYAIPFRTLEDAYRLEERLRQLEGSAADKLRVAIVGGGYVGVELACKLADRLQQRGRIRLIEQADEILRTSTEFNRTAAQQALEEKGIWIDLETTVESIQATEMSLVYKGQVDTIPVDLVLWTVGNRMHPVISELGLKQNQRGQLVVTPTLQVHEHPDIFALGDLADCRDAEGQQVPSTAQAAFQQADYVSWNLWADLTEQPLLPFRYQQLGEMMTLGTQNATFTGLGLKLEGPLAHLTRRFAYWYRLPTLEHQLKVGLHWVTRPVFELLNANFSQG